jgi:translocation protein SEC63
MGKYHYDESGNMAAYFVLTFLAIVLIPLSLSFTPTSSSGELAAILSSGVY